MKIKKNINKGPGLLVDPRTKSSSYHHTIVWKTVRRISKDIVGMNGLNA